MTVRDVDVEYTFDDPDDGWFGRAAVVDPEPPSPQHVGDDPGVDDVGADDTDTDTWYMNVADPTSAEFVGDLHQEPLQDSAIEDPAATPFDEVPTRGHVGLAAPRPESWESRVSNSGAWDFKAPISSSPWYRSKYGVVAAVAVAAVAVGIVALVVRSPAPALDDSTTVAPSDPSQPAPTSQGPLLSSQAPAPVPPPVPLPPPPPASAEEINPPAVDRQYSPSYQTPDTSEKPQMNVTRAPLSAAPPPPPSATDRDSSTPGDAPHRRHGFF